MMILLQIFWMLAPAMSTNCIAALYGGKIPIDFGKKFIDGNRIFGDGKTWKGYIYGTVLGAVFGIPWYALGYFGLGIPLPHDLPFFLLLTCWLAMTGDLFGSFIKRRLGFKRGERAIVIDQLMFYYFMMAFLYATDYRVYFPLWETLVELPLIVFFLHCTFNYIGYKLNLKSVPW